MSTSCTCGLEMQVHGQQFVCPACGRRWARLGGQPGTSTVPVRLVSTPEALRLLASGSNETAETTDTNGTNDEARFLRVAGERALFVVSMPLTRVLLTRVVGRRRAVLGTLGPYVELTEVGWEELKLAGVKEFR